MRLRLSLWMVMIIVAGCAVVLAIVRSVLWDEWDEDLRVAARIGLALWNGRDESLRQSARIGLVFGGLATLLSYLLLWIVARDAPWRRKLGADPRTEPHFWVRAWHRTLPGAIRFYARWPALLKEAFWASCTALGLVLLLDQVSGGAWWNAGAPGEIGGTDFTLLVAGVVFVVCVVWTWFAPSAAKDALARLEKKWLHGRHMARLCARCRAALTWLLAASPAWFRILLAWLLAAVSVLLAHLVIVGIFHVGPQTNPYAIVLPFLAVLVVWLLVCLAILARGLYDMSRAFFPRLGAIVAAFTLSAVHILAFFRLARRL